MIGSKSQLSLLTAILFSIASGAASARPSECSQIFRSSDDAIIRSSFNDVVSVMNRSTYDPQRLPVIPLRMYKWVGRRLVFFVGQRSKEILIDKRDYREVGEEKPIHPMGVGLAGKMTMQPSRWSGIFRGGESPVIARASISQGNPFKYDASGKMQVRSTAMAIKLFSTKNNAEPVKTVNAVFQNNLNGLLGRDGKPLNYLDSAQTNQPGIDFSKIDQRYQVETLLGVAYGAIMNPRDHMSKVPFINPQIRPVHSWAELGEENPKDVRTPIWVKIEPRLSKPTVEENDFRLEIAKTLERDGKLIYEVFAADQQDSRGAIQWEKVGQLQFDQSILSAAVDQNLLFPHDSLNSKFTDQKFAIPEPSSQFDSVPEDLQ